jgi:hypothetical protein
MSPRPCDDLDLRPGTDCGGYAGGVGSSLVRLDRSVFGAARSRRESARSVAASARARRDAVSAGISRSSATLAAMSRWLATASRTLAASSRLSASTSNFALDQHGALEPPHAIPNAPRVLQRRPLSRPSRAHGVPHPRRDAFWVRDGRVARAAPTEFPDALGTSTPWLSCGCQAALLQSLHVMSGA